MIDWKIRLEEKLKKSVVELTGIIMFLYIIKYKIVFNINFRKVFFFIER